MRSDSFPIYDMPLFRPPSEGENLIIQATLGCSFNRCSFCAMYRTKEYVERPLEAVFEDIEQAAKDWPGASRLFLADGDALALPTEQLVQILDKLAATLPRLTRVTCYATPANILRKTAEELAQLKAHKLNLLYFGIESGSDLILKKVTKGATQRGIFDALNRAHDAGLKISATVVLGLGGKTHWQEHIDGTIELLNRAPINYLSTLQLFLDEGSVDEFHHKFAEPFSFQDDAAILQEQQRLISGLRPPQPIIFRSNHASNALALAGNLPRDRERLLAQLQHAMADSSQLRPHHIRGL
ncbi:MAG: radical SAM protein [Gammaproteobacteria bacterium]|nr:radical SAM protein [Gammaproteobacteria bacterium]